MKRTFISTMYRLLSMLYFFLSEMNIVSQFWKTVLLKFCQPSNLEMTSINHDFCFFLKKFISCSITKTSSNSIVHDLNSVKYDIIYLCMNSVSRPQNNQDIFFLNNSTHQNILISCVHNKPIVILYIDKYFHKCRVLLPGVILPFKLRKDIVGSRIITTIQ